MKNNTHAGRVVMISGAASGIGAAIAERYCNEGASVALLDVNRADLSVWANELSSQGFTVAWAVADVADYSACTEACNLLVSQLGPVDTLINNAGISPKHAGKPASFWEMDPEEWRKVVGVNLNGAFNLSRILSPGMAERQFGRILNMSSVAAKVHLPLVAAHYSATKAALIGLTRHLAGELGPYGINVNAIAPGRIETPLLKTVADDINRQAVSQTALRRLGTAEEVADTACFLTSAQSNFVTGQVIDVAGGWLMS
ncbi:SDR family oxidoreductase [Aliamphritea hakodatensis]|uniref:SDR family oxidoreductase n=1 Tax=Aliamphritea hakodatensis TaxID=2895352 RepID=UPI0022FD9A6A|nr:SDR family NAD(P)-dependent oxidoreductase [Aliamphritea hakodatensis]